MEQSSCEANSSSSNQRNLLKNTQ